MLASQFEGLPVTWELQEFGDVAKITCGVAATPEYVNESIGVPFLSARNVQNEKLDLSKYLHIPRNLHEKLTKNTKPEKGDVLLTRVGAGIGEAALVDIDFEFSVYVSLTLIKCGKRLNSEFVKLLLNTNYYRYLAARDQFAGGGVQNLNVQMVKKYPIPIPSLPEQTKIAQILSTWDKAIEGTEKLIENSKAQKKALMQQLLTGKKRFHEFITKNGVYKTKYGELPKDWRFVQIGELAEEVSERNTVGDQVPVLSCSKYEGFVDSLKYFKKKVYSDDTSNYKVVKRCSFGFPSNHIEEGSIGYQDICDCGIVSPIYTVFRTNEKVHDGYLYKLLKTDHYRQIFAASTNASVDRRGSLRWKEFRKIRVPLPDSREQARISAAIDQAERSTTNLQSQCDSLRDQKKALMQQLLTGKRRVKLDKNEATQMAV